MAYIVKDEQGHPIIHKGSNIMGCDVFEAKGIKDFQDKSRSFLAVASAESPDRFKDIIMVKGWQLKDYRKNPVVQMAHNYSKHPMGRSLEEFADSKKGVERLMFRPQFHGLDEESRLLYTLYKSKYLAGFSVGFLPLKSEKIEKPDKKKDDVSMWNTPTRFLKQILLEVSVVPVPAHQDALSEIRAMVKKGSLYIPARYLQKEQKPEIETYDEYIHVKVEDEGRFTSLYEDEIGDGIIRVYGPVEGEKGFINHKFIFAKERYNEEKAKDSVSLLAEESYPDDIKNYDPEFYAAKETVLIADFPVVKDEDFEGQRREALDIDTDTNTEEGTEDTKIKDESDKAIKDGGDKNVKEDIECGDCLEMLAQEYVIGKDIEFAEEEFVGEEDVEEKPYPNEHSCRLLPSGDFDRIARKNCFRKSNGKCIDFIFGIKAGKSKVVSMRYKKDIWTAASARTHCKGAGGAFEAASKDAKVFVYSTKEMLEENQMKVIKDNLQNVLREDAKILILDSGASLTSICDETLDTIKAVLDVSDKMLEKQEEAEETVDEKDETILDEFLKYAKYLDISVEDKEKDTLKGEVLDAIEKDYQEHEKLEKKEFHKYLKDNQEMLMWFNKSAEGAIDIKIKEDDNSVVAEIHALTEEFKSLKESLLDEVVERVVRAVRSTFKDESKKTNEEEGIVDPDLEDAGIEEELDIDIEEEETDAGKDEIDVNEDDVREAVSDSLKEVLGRLD